MSVYCYNACAIESRAFRGAGSWSGSYFVVCFTILIKREGRKNTAVICEGDIVKEAACSWEEKHRGELCGQGDAGRNREQQMSFFLSSFWSKWRTLDIIVVLQDDGLCLCFINAIIHQQNRTHTVQQVFHHSEVPCYWYSWAWCFWHLLIVIFFVFWNL